MNILDDKKLLTPPTVEGTHPWAEYPALTPWWAVGLYPRGGAGNFRLQQWGACLLSVTTGDRWNHSVKHELIFSGPFYTIHCFCGK